MTHIITLSLLIIAVIAVRAVFRRSASPKMIYALWLVVLLKLCLPFQLFELEVPGFAWVQSGADISDIGAETGSIYTPPETQSNFSGEYIPVSPIIPAESNGASHGNDITEKVPGFEEGTGLSYDTHSSVSEGSVPGSVNGDAEQEPPKKALSVSSVLKAVWIGGSVLLTLWFALANALFSLGVQRDRKRIGKYKGLKVYVSAKVGTPCLHGILPSVYLTPKAYKSEGRRMILLHEYTHLCHGDNIWAFFRICAVILLWWNPLVWLAAVLSKKDAELACDYAVTKKMRSCDRIEYAKVIIDMLPVKRSYATGFSNNSVKERIIMMTKKRKNKILSTILALVLVMSAVSCSFITIKESVDTTDTNEEETNNETEPPPVDEDEDEGEGEGEGETEDNIVLTLLQNTKDMSVKYISLPTTANKLIYDYEGPMFSSDKRLFRVDRTKEYGTFDLYLVDIKNGTLLDTLTVYSDIMPTGAMIKNRDYILYRMYYDTEQQKSVVETAFKVTYENGELICRETEIEMYPFYQKYIENEDKTVRAYSVVTDEGGHGGIDIVYSDGRVERICENVMLDDEIGGKTAGIGDVKGYTPIAFLDENRFAYHIGGWEWTCGYGIYDISTGEKTENLEGLGLRAFDDEGNLYVSKVTSYQVTHYYKITPGGEKILLASKEDELADEDVIKLESHGNISYGYENNYGKIYEVFEDGKPILTVTSPDFKKVLFKCELDNSKGEIHYFIKDNAITFVCFGNEPSYPYTEKSELTEIFKQFLAGGKEGDEGEVLKRRMIELTGWQDEETAGEEPQVYFTKWQDKAIELYTTAVHEKLKTEEPEYYLLGSLTEKYFDYYDFFGFIPNSNAELEITAEPWDMTYYYLCRDRNDPKKTYVYYTENFGRNVSSVDIEIPLDYDTVTPIYMGREGSSDICRMVYMLTLGTETFYVTLDNEGTDSLHTFKYVGITDQQFLESVIGPRYVLEERVDIGDGHELQIELKYDKNNIEKSQRAAYSYENDAVNELYMWKIVKVFGNNSRYALIASDRYPAYVIADTEELTVTNAFPNLDKELIAKIETVETHDGEQFAIQLDNGKIYYHESFNKFTVDIEELGVLGADYAEIADRSTLAIFKVENGYADIYTKHVISGEEKLLFSKIPWNENDPKALKLHSSKGYGTYFIRDALHIVDFRTRALKPAGVEYSVGIKVLGINEYTVNIKWENLGYINRGVPVR